MPEVIFLEQKNNAETINDIWTHGAADFFPQQMVLEFKSVWCKMSAYINLGKCANQQVFAALHGVPLHNNSDHVQIHIHRV